MRSLIILALILVPMTALMGLIGLDNTAGLFWMIFVIGNAITAHRIR